MMDSGTMTRASEHGSSGEIALALGSGGTRGFAHIGVLEVLEQEGISVRAIAGSSIGALIGSIYATGAPVDRMRRLASELPLGQWVDLTVPRMGFIAGERLHRLIRLLTKNRAFEDTTIPLAVVATDVEQGERVVFTTGPIHDAVRASVAIPGILVPHRANGRLLVDGGVVDRVPIQAARDLYPGFVVAVDVGLFERLPEVKNVLDVIVQSFDIMQRELFRSRVLDADFVVRPRLEFMSSTGFGGVKEAIEAGREAMREAMPGLLQALRQREESTAYGDTGGSGR